MGMECVFQNFEFGPPWDKAYHACCLESQPSTTSPTSISTAVTATNQKRATNIPTPGEYMAEDKDRAHLL
jgi:hypothetical protein